MAEDSARGVHVNVAAALAGLLLVGGLATAMALDLSGVDADPAPGGAGAWVLSVEAGEGELHLVNDRTAFLSFPLDSATAQVSPVRAAPEPRSFALERAVAGWGGPKAAEVALEAEHAEVRMNVVLARPEIDGGTVTFLVRPQERVDLPTLEFSQVTVEVARFPVTGELEDG